MVVDIRVVVVLVVVPLMVVVVMVVLMVIIIMSTPTPTIRNPRSSSGKLSLEGSPRASRDLKERLHQVDP